jgi:predicted O-linked N-acetylglucosamine transferase (SPINDLY family)
VPGQAVATLLAQGLADHRAGRLAEAAAAYRSVLAQAPDQFDALHLLGVIEQQCGRPQQALAWFERALAVDASTAPVHANRGAVLRELQRLDEALAALDRALALDPRHAKALANRAAVRLDRADAAGALDDAQAALAIAPTDVAALYNLASALKQLGRRDEARAAFGVVRQCLSDFAPLHVHLGELLREAGRPLEALGQFERATTLDPRDAAAWTNRGHVLADQGRHDEARASYQAALALEPEAPGLLGHWLHARLQACDWDGLAADFARLAALIDAGRPVCEPFVALLTPLSALQQRRCAELHVQHVQHGEPAPAWPAAHAEPRRDDDRLRIGYFSADFREHATAQLLVGVLEAHDRRAVEVSAFAFGPPVEDAKRARIRDGVEHFVEVHALSDEAIVAFARERGLHVAVDLGGMTRGARPGVFARRAAPVQVAWLGFAGTSGAPFIDYAIADRVVLPAECAGEFSEAIAWMPACYQPNDDRRPIASPRPTRAACGLPDDAFVFCCFNQAAKITPAVFAIWMEVLRARPRSVLWLLQPGPPAMARLQHAAFAAGVAPERLVFAPRCAPAEHLARHAAADLFLDTWPYNAHTTASDALWAGLPVLTRVGETFAGRVAASLLHAAGLPELVAPTAATYRAAALSLSHDRAALDALRDHLAARRTDCALFDTTRSTRAVESAFRAMWQRHAAGLAPASFVVDA